MNRRSPTSKEVVAAWRVIALDYAHRMTKGNLRRAYDLTEGFTDPNGELAYGLSNTLLDLVLAHTRVSDNEFFKLCKSAAFDRPSAFDRWMALHRPCERPRDLDMRELSPEELTYLRKYFRRLPPELVADDWDT